MQASVLLRIPMLSLPSNAYNTAHESCLPFKIWMPLIGGVAYFRQSRTTGNLCAAGQGPLEYNCRYGTTYRSIRSWDDLQSLGM